MTLFALSETQIVDLPQVCLPIGMDAKRQTLCEKTVEGKVLLGPGREDNSTEKTRCMRLHRVSENVMQKRLCPPLMEALAHREGLTELPRRRWTHQKYAVGDWRVQGG
jgi:hypothetical protein